MTASGSTTPRAEGSAARRRPLASAHLLRDVLDALTPTMAVLDTEGTILAVNAAWNRFALDNGADPDAVGVGASYLRACDAAAGADAEMARAVARAIRELVAGSRTAFRTDYACHAPERLRWCNLHATRLIAPEGIRILVTHEDVTAQTLAEERRRRSDERLAAVFEHALDAILLAGDDGRYLDANPAACDLLGYRREELLQRGVWDLTPGLDLARGQQLWAAFIAEGRQHGEYRLMRKDGTPVDVEYRAVANILPELHLSILRDITARRAAERQLQQLNETLEARVTARTAQVRQLATALTLAEQRERERISHVLHDGLQQILYGAQIKLQMLARYGDPQVAGAVHDELHAINGLLDDAIATSRSLAVELTPPILHEDGLGASLHWLASQMHDLHHLEVDLDVQDDCEVANRDLVVLLTHCVRELLFNVVKHAGTQRARVAAWAEEGFLHIRVADEGCGFDAEKFDTEGSDARQETAGGFGLFSIRERLALLGGTLAVDARPDAGTRVLLTLPDAGHGA